MNIPKEFHLAILISNDDERHELKLECETTLKFPEIELTTQGYSIYNELGRQIVYLDCYDMIEYIENNYKNFEESE
jgi:hypothetical protein